MGDQPTERRRRVAALLRDLYDGRITNADFFRVARAVDAGDDAELRELIELVADEPAGSWFFGVAGEEHRGRVERIRKFVEAYG